MGSTCSLEGKDNVSAHVQKTLLVTLWSLCEPIGYSSPACGRKDQHVGTLHVGMPGKPITSTGGILNHYLGQQQTMGSHLMLDPGVMPLVVIAKNTRCITLIINILEGCFID